MSSSCGEMKHNEEMETANQNEHLKNPLVEPT